MIKEELIQKLYTLQEMMESCNVEINELTDQRSFLQDGDELKGFCKQMAVLNRRSDIYDEYKRLIEAEVGEGCITAVERAVGMGHFVDKEFIDELAYKLENIVVLDEYKGYSLKKDYNRYGSLTYYVYDMNNVCIQSDILSPTDYSAITTFRGMVDHSHWLY